MQMPMSNRASSSVVTNEAQPARHRLVVAVDYGTTYSGVAFGTTNASSIDNLNVIRTWPGRDGEWKVPSRIAYAHENIKYGLKDKNAWGYDVDPIMISCSWTKLLLDMDTVQSAHDDPNLQFAVDQGMLRTPEDYTAQQVCSDYLKEIHKYVMARLIKQYSKQVLDSTPIDCWLTVPAVWSDHAQSSTMAAAQAAGFGCGLKNTINIISEPEAGAIAALEKFMHEGSLNRLRKFENIMVCDCGGGTVDITTYSMVEVEPRLEFEELLVGIGAKCGATSVDRNLYELMRKRFGRAFEDIEMRRKGPGSRFMNSWESVKRGFPAQPDTLVKEIGPLNMKGAWSSAIYDEEECMVRLSRQDIESLFAPVVSTILSMINEQNAAVRQKKNSTIHRLVLIGGFGDSDYLHSRLKAWCAANEDIQLLCPEHPQAAIVRGAALRGLEGIAPSQKCCRRSYGVGTLQLFREGIDPEQKAQWNKWDGTKRCHGRMDWLIAKGEAINKSTKRAIKLSLPATRTEDRKTTCTLYSCASDEYPEYIDSPGIEKVGDIVIDLTHVDKSKMPKRREGILKRTVVNFEFDVVVEFGNKTGILEVKSLVNSSVLGVTRLKFD